jgi:hypothetical protein
MEEYEGRQATTIATGISSIGKPLSMLRSVTNEPILNGGIVFAVSGKIQEHLLFDVFISAIFLESVQIIEPKNNDVIDR